MAHGQINQLQTDHAKHKGIKFLKFLCVVERHLSRQLSYQFWIIVTF